MGVALDGTVLAVRAAMGNETATNSKKRDLDGDGTVLLGDFFSSYFLDTPSYEQLWSAAVLIEVTMVSLL
jgi:hypothetical protein